MSKEAMKLAREWYDSGNENSDDFDSMIKQVIALAEQRQEIDPETRTKDGLKYSPNYVAGYNDGLKAAQPQQEPVAMSFDDAWVSLRWAEWRMRPPKELFAELHRLTSPQPAQRKPLTDDEIWDEVKATDSYIKFARAIEAAHGIKE